MWKRHFVLSMSCVVLFVYLILTANLSFGLTPRDIYQKAGPGVVFIYATDGNKTGSGGTGSIIRNDGLVITNAHIFQPKGVHRMLSDITVYLKPDRVTGSHKKDLANGFRGDILAYDRSLDLALIKIRAAGQSLHTVDFADSDEVNIGDRVYAIGHPEQGGLWSLTTGVISAYRRDYGGVRGKHLFQTDASINRGNSGGPLLDEDGDMVGINSLIARKAADGMTITDVNFSLKTNVALNWLKTKGYMFAAKQKAPIGTPKPIAATPKSEPKQAEPPVMDTVTKPKPEIVSSPQENSTEMDSSDDLKETVEKKEDKSSETEQTDEKTPQQPAISDDSPDSGDPMQPEGKILTEKKPYNMDELIEGMQEMEDLMDEMRDFMDDFKQNQKRRSP